jgi:signal transduction histidine kinase
VDLGSWAIASTAALTAACYLLVGAAVPGAPPSDVSVGMLAGRAALLATLGAVVVSARVSHTERRADGRRLTTMYAAWKSQMLALERARGDLLAHVSHELMTPLAAIQAGAGMLAEAAGEPPVDGALGAGSETQQRLARNIERNAVRLTLLVDDLLELARIEEGRPRLQLAWHPCACLLQRAVDAVAPLALGQCQRVTWHVLEEGLMYWGEAHRIEQVMINLLANAHKYAGGGAHITAAAWRDRDGVRLEVCDDGPGLPPEAIPALFDRYYRVPGSAGRGSGLGLAIARAQIELHGGRIWAENSGGRGCRFSCWIPEPDQANVLRACADAEVLE